MKIYKNIFFITICVLFGCTSSKLSYKSNISSKDINETEYYRLFTEATKFNLLAQESKDSQLSNLKHALGLYNECVIRYPNHAASYYQLSEIFLHIQDLKKAHDYGKIAEKLDSTNVWYKINLANIYQVDNKYDSAAILYEKIVELEPTPENYYNLSLLYSQCGKNTEALKVLNKLEDDFDKSKEVFLMKHNIFNNLRQYDSAIYELETLTKYFPDDISNQGILAEYLSGIGRNDYAKEVYLEAVTKDSTNGLILLSFGDFFMKNKNIDSAFYYYDIAFCCSDLSNENKISVILNFISDKELVAVESDRIEELLNNINNDKHDYKIYSAYADLFINQQKYAEAKVYLDTALIFEKKNYVLWEQAIMINNYLKNNEEAISKAKECISIFPDKANPYLLKAYSEEALGYNDSAIIDVNLLLKLNPDKSIKIQAYNILAEIYRLKEQYNLSDKYYEDILLIDPENLMIRNNYGYYLSVRGEKLDRAKELSSLTIQKEPNNATYLDTYGWILFRMDKVKEAKEYIEEAIRFGAVNNPEVLDHFGQIMLKLDKCKDAIEAWERVLEIDSTYNIRQKLFEVKEICR
jgi:tetratricopeptide (TPR) repeat protein